MFGLFRKRFDRLVARGDRYHERGQLGLARGEYATALAHFREGDDAAERDRVQIRLSELQRALAERQIDEGRSMSRTRDFRLAESCFEAAMTLAQGHHDDLYQEAARLLERSLDREEAWAAEQAALQAAEEPEPEPDLEAEFELLIQAFDTSREEIYRRLGADEGFLHGYLALNDGDATLALGLFRGIELDGEEPWLRYEIGRAMLLMADQSDGDGDGDGLIDAALSELVAAAAGIDGVQALPVLTYLAQIAMRAGDFEEAEIAVERYRQIADPHAEDPVILRMALERARGAFDAARRVARQRLAQTPSSRPIWRMLGETCEQAEDPAGAIEAYEQVVQLHWRFDPGRRIVQCDPFAAARLTRLYIERSSDLDRAMQLATALELMASPEERLPIRGLKVEILRAAGDDASAEALLEELLEEAPEALAAQLRERLSPPRDG